MNLNIKIILNTFTTPGELLQKLKKNPEISAY